MNTFLQILFFLSLFLITACSSSYEINSTSPTYDSSIQEFNELAEGEEAEIILADSTVITATDLYLSADSLYWFNPETKLKTGVVKSEISKVMFKDWGLGGLEGAGFGFLSGGAVGVLLLAGADAVGSELDDSAYTEGFAATAAGGRWGSTIPASVPDPRGSRVGGSYPPFPGGGGGGYSSGPDDRVNASALRQITDDSGGRTEIVSDPRDLDPATATIAGELSKQYYIGYPSPGHKDGRWHSIRVEVRDPSLRVRARRGYIATP